MSSNVNFRVPQKIEDESLFDITNSSLTLYNYNIVIESNANYIEHVGKGEGAPVVQFVQGSSFEILTATLESRTDIPYGVGKQIRCQGTFSTSFNLMFDDNYQLKVIQQPANNNIPVIDKTITSNQDKSSISNDFVYYLDIPDKIIYIYMDSNNTSKPFYINL